MYMSGGPNSFEREMQLRRQKEPCLTGFLSSTRGTEGFPLLPVHRRFLRFLPTFNAGRSAFRSPEFNLEPQNLAENPAVIKAFAQTILLQDVILFRLVLKCGHAEPSFIVRLCDRVAGTIKVQRQTFTTIR